jgi:hypothetical protein
VNIDIFGLDPGVEIALLLLLKEWQGLENDKYSIQGHLSFRTV